MPTIRVAAAAAHFGRNLDACLTRIAGVLADAAERDADLVVLPHAALGGYLGSLDGDGWPDLPPALEPGGLAVERLVALAGRRVVCAGYTEGDGDRRYNAAVCVSGDGVLGRHRKVHQPPGEAAFFDPGSCIHAFDTPVGRLGMLIDYDKTFPEAARTLALDGAEVLAFLSAWPASVTNRSPRLVNDRQTRLFDLYDCARAAENQVVVVSANQTGMLGHLRFLGRAKVVGPGGEILARTTAKAGLAVADVDLAAQLSRARRVLDHLASRRPAAYRM
ncbi:MAG TPA: carbon-nitrogen hydrolase family protein [Solirubrobacterales bacterium]|nr:carbon-nitrogen hydrolase family protein [Solirubrobacterales bacterium]